MFKEGDMVTVAYDDSKYEKAVGVIQRHDDDNTSLVKFGDDLIWFCDEHLMLYEQLQPGNLAGLFK